MSKNVEIAKMILNFKTNIRRNVKLLNIEVKLASNQRDDAARVNDFLKERINYKI